MPGEKRRIDEGTLDADRMFLSVAIRTPRSDQMDHPSEKANGTDPRNPVKMSHIIPIRILPL
jgi:hypothetical protein